MLRKIWFLKSKLKSAPSIKLLANNTFIRSKLEYAAVIWEPFTIKDVVLLEKNITKGRFIFNKYQRLDSPRTITKLHKISLLETSWKLNHLTFLYKITSGKGALNAPCCVQSATSRNTRRTHHRSLVPIFAPTNAYKYSYFPRIVDDWNSLFHEIFLAGILLYRWKVIYLVIRMFKCVINFVAVSQTCDLAHGYMFVPGTSSVCACMSNHSLHFSILNVKKIQALNQNFQEIITI